MANDKKSWVEIVLMPLVVAVVGIGGARMIACQQDTNARLMSETELTAAGKQADADRQVKLLELFAEQVFSEAEETRELGLRRLRAPSSCRPVSSRAVELNRFAVTLYERSCCIERLKFPGVDFGVAG